MTIFATFALGKKESYFFNTPTHWAWHNLPPDIEALFTQTPAIQDVIELALGSNSTYFVSYRDHGQVLCKHYNLPNALTAWLYADQPSIVRDLATLSVALGPYDSYYAWDQHAASWSNLPPKMEKAVLSRLDSQDAWRTSWKAAGAEAPSFVSLGADGAYWMRTVCGGGCWDLKCSVAPGNVGAVDGMAGLRGTNKFLEESSDFNGVAALHLFPSHPNAYVLITTTGKAFANLPECTWPDYGKIAPALPCFVQGMLPIPPMPQPRQQLAATSTATPRMQQQQQQQQQQQYNCCPCSAPPSAAHNCCAQQPMQPRPFGLPGYTHGVPFALQSAQGNVPAPGHQTRYAQAGYQGGAV